MTSTDPGPDTTSPDPTTDREVGLLRFAPELPKAGPVPGEGRRGGKGHITSYGRGRACSTPGCRTVLSMYNHTGACAEHSPLRASDGSVIPLG